MGNRADGYCDCIERRDDDKWVVRCECGNLDDACEAQDWCTRKNESWKFDVDSMPKDVPLIVYLAEDMCGLRVHTARYMRAGTGHHILIVGSTFGHDAPAILAWRPMVELPDSEALRLAEALHILKAARVT